MHLTPILVFALLAGSFAVAEDPVLHSPAGTVTFSPSTGAIIAMTPPNATGSVWQSGENGLWSARFANRTQLNAARFHATNTLFRFSWQAGPDKDALTFVYTASNLAVNVVARPCSDGIELSAEVAPAVQTLLRFDLPGRLRFSPASVKRFVFPHGVNTGPGAAFTQAFFERYPDTRPPRHLENRPPEDPRAIGSFAARRSFSATSSTPPYRSPSQTRDAAGCRLPSRPASPPPKSPSIVRRPAHKPIS